MAQNDNAAATTAGVDNLEVDHSAVAAHLGIEEARFKCRTNAGEYLAFAVPGKHLASARAALIAEGKPHGLSDICLSIGQNWKKT